MMSKYIVITILVILVALIGLMIFSKNKPVNTIKETEQQKIVIPTPIPVTLVILDENGFTPSSISIKTGDTVQWENKSIKEGSVSSDPHPTHELYPFLNLGIFPAGSRVSTRFEKAGTYTYHNHLSPSQKGTVIVE